MKTKSPLPAVTVEPVTANPANDPCKTSTSTPFLHVALPTGTGDHVEVIDAATNDNETADPRTASARAGVLDVQLGGTLLSAQVLTSSANESQQPVCGGDVTRNGDSHVVRVVLNGTVIEVPTAKSDPAHPTLSLPLPAPLGPVNLFLREEIAVPGRDGSLTERALELDTGLVNVVVAESRVDDWTDVPCPPCIEPGSNPPRPDAEEHDPMVDPTTTGEHPDCEPFSPPEGNGDPTGRDYVHFDRSINDTDESPDGAFAPDNSNPDSRNRFYGDAGFEHDGDTMLTLEGKFYDDEDMHFRLAPLTIDAYYAPDDLAASPWRRFCGTGVIEPFEASSDGLDMTPPSAPFAPGQVRKFLVETFDEKWLNPDAPGGDQSDYWVIDIYAQNTNFDTKTCDPSVGDRDHGDRNPGNDEANTLDYHSEGQTIAGNIEIHSNRVMQAS